MIIQIRGTSGSGKSTAMRAVMSAFGPWNPIYFPGRKKPLAYLSGNLMVMGHYEIDCGGCDTIGSAPEVYKAIKEVAFTLFDPIVEVEGIILTEGLLWGEDVKWTLELSKQGLGTIRAYFLTTPLETCLEWVKQRQNGREPADPDRVVRKLSRRIGTIESARQRLTAAGVDCFRCSATQCPQLIIRYIRKVLDNA